MRKRFAASADTESFPSLFITPIYKDEAEEEGLQARKPHLQSWEDLSKMATGPSKTTCFLPVDDSAPMGISGFLPPPGLDRDVSEEVWPQDCIFLGSRELGVPVHSQAKSHLIGQLKMRVPAVPSGEHLPQQRDQGCRCHEYYPAEGARQSNRWVSLNILLHCLSLGLKWKLTFPSPVATAEFFTFAGILHAAL